MTAPDRLFVNVDAGGLHGTAEWERVTATERLARYISTGLDPRRRGAPDYVEHVYRQIPF